MTNQDNRSYIPVNRTGDDCPQTESSGHLQNPPVLAWYKAYCVATALMYGLVILAGLFMLMAPAFLKEFVRSTGKTAESVDQAVNMVMGGIYVAIGLFFMIVYLAGAFLPVRPWAWVVGIVLIAFSFTSCCCIPFAIPVLIYWIKPATKACFHAY